MLMSNHFDAPESLEVSLNFFLKHKHIIMRKITIFLIYSSLPTSQPHVPAPPEAVLS